MIPISAAYTKKARVKQGINHINELCGQLWSRFQPEL